VQGEGRHFKRVTSTGPQRRKRTKKGGGKENNTKYTQVTQQTHSISAVGTRLARHTGMPRGQRIQLNPTRDPMIALDQSHTAVPIHTSNKTTISHSTSSGSSETNVPNVIHSLCVHFTNSTRPGALDRVLEMLHTARDVRVTYPTWKICDRN
jgi:hypothetical protein